MPSRGNMRHSDNEPYIRLTVARRRRYCTVFPSTKSAVEVEGRSPLWIKVVGSAELPD
jgi:hypothetical protein